MRESHFLCLAVSRRDGGNCIAGIDIDTGEWIRPVNSKNHGALFDFEIVVEDCRTRKLRVMAVLDLVNLRLGEPVGTEGQPENWTLHETKDSGAHIVFGCAGDERPLISRIKKLAAGSSSFTQIFGTPGNRVPHSTIENSPIGYSLCVIRPNNLTWARTTDFHKKSRVEAQFEFGTLGAYYCLRLTDIAWEQKLLKDTQQKPILKESSLPGADATQEILLTVSLGDHFKETGYHYKLVAGVLLLPRT